MKTYVFDEIYMDDVPVVAAQMLQENNVEQLRALYKHASTPPNDSRKEHMKSALLDFLLEDDQRLGIATRVLDSKTIARWVDNHVEKVVKQCPRLFDRYAQPDQHYMFWLGHHYANLDEATKVGIFQGTATTTAHLFMYHALKTDPSLWDSLTPIWFGSNRSPLRQAATDLGWKSNTMTGVFSKPLRAHQVNEWGAVLAYPHSMAVVVAVLLKDKPRVVRQGLSNLIGAMAGWSGVEPNQLPLSLANPRDTTLAALLIEKTQYPYVLGDCAPKEDLEPQEMAFLRSIVDVHIGVDCLELLLHALEQDRLPGDMLGMQEGIGLPGDMYVLPNLS